MIKHKALILAVIVMLGGTSAVSCRTLADLVHTGPNPAIAIQRRSRLVQQALTHLGDRDAGEAQLAYHRKTHSVMFLVTDYDYRNRFKGKALAEQMKYFCAKTHLSSVTPQVVIAKRAIKKHDTQVTEQRQQRAENHAEAVAIQKKEQAEARAKAKQKAEQQKKARLAKQRKEARQHAEQQQKKRERSKRHSK